MDVLYKGRCWKYDVPKHCYLARDWSSTSACVPAELVIWAAPPPSKSSPSSSSSAAAVLKLTELKSGLSVTARLPAAAGSSSSSSSATAAAAMVVHRVDDSQRYYVLVLPQQQQQQTVSVGLGFQSREESGVFAEAVAHATGAPLPPYRGGSSSAQLHAQAQPSAAGVVAAAIAAVASSSSSSVPSPSPVDLPSSLRAVPGGGGSSGSSAESPALTAATPHVRAQEPDVSVVDDTRVRATRASFAPKPEQPLLPEKEEAAAAAAAKEEEEEEEESPVAVVGERKHMNEDSTLPEWRAHRKHVFMLSNAGKPIYSRYGDEQKLAPFMASLMALVSFVADTNDQLRYFVAGGRTVVFLTRGPVILVGVCGTGESRQAITRMLFNVHAQVASVLTASSISKIFAKRPDFDLRGLLVGTDRVVDNLVHHINHSAAMMLNAVHPLPLPASVRSNVEAALAAAACPELLFAVLISGFSLVHMARPRRFTLDPVDMHILMNFVNSSKSFRVNSSWTPLCLPMFDDKGFLHAYICYLTHDLCLVLLSAKVDAFYKLNECKDTISAHLEASGALKAIADAGARPEYRAIDVGSPGLLHFLYKVQSTRQMTAPALDVPYNTASEQKRLFRAYQDIKERIEAQPGSPHKVYYRVSQRETIVAWATRGFELYATFGPLESKSQAIKACNKVIVWTLQQEADLFILNSPMW